MNPKKQIKSVPANVKKAAWNLPGAVMKVAKSPFDPPVKTVTAKIRYLQRTMGNHAVRRFFESDHVFQAKPRSFSVAGSERSIGTKVFLNSIDGPTTISIGVGPR